MSAWSDLLARRLPHKSTPLSAAALLEPVLFDPDLAGALAPPAEPAPAPLAQAGADVDEDLDLRFFAWLIDTRVAPGAGLTDGEARLLAALDETLVSSAAREDLLPRARSVIPQRLHSLRDEQPPLRELAQRVVRDPNLVVEVIRMANSAAFGAREPVADLMHNVGWSRSLRVFDRGGQGAQALRPSASAAFVRALAERREALFALLVRAWRMGAALDGLADEILVQGAARASSPLARAPYAADRAASAAVMGSAA